jgi:hypothetical protein
MAADGVARLLPAECPNCGHRHEGHDFRDDPGLVQKHLAALAEAAITLVEAYQEAGMSGPADDNVNSALTDIEEAGLLSFEVVVKHG